jgi:hypothetical protein
VKESACVTQRFAAGQLGSVIAFVLLALIARS